mgnify:CR=1 FL=1
MIRLTEYASILGRRRGLRLGLSLCLSSSLIFFAAARAHAACVVYEGPAFSGPNLTIADNAGRADLGAMNDKVSSVKVGPQCLMQAYADTEFKGAQTTFGPGNHPHLGEGWDDQISSARCNCR